jgi:hypothetical protein
MASLVKRRNEFPEMGIELRGSAGQVDQPAPDTFCRLQDLFHDIPSHDFVSFGRGFQVAVRTLLVAQEPKIDLQRFNVCTIQSLTVDSSNPSFEVIHRYSF